MVVQLSSGPGSYLRVSECALAVGDWRWPLEELHRDDIADDWERRRTTAPGLFNGTVYLFRDYAIDSGRLTGDLFKTDFKTLVYWRSLPPAPGDTILEASGASLIRSSEGHLLYGRQGPGQYNSGLIYPPSGVFDASDVSADVIDIDASIARELGEETGLAPSDLQRALGYIVGFAGSHVSVGVEWRSSLPAVDLRQRIMAFLGSQSEPELDDIVIVRTHSELPEEGTTLQARVFAQAMLGAA